MSIPGVYAACLDYARGDIIHFHERHITTRNGICILLTIRIPGLNQHRSALDFVHRHLNLLQTPGVVFLMPRSSISYALYMSCYIT